MADTTLDPTAVTPPIVVDPSSAKALLGTLCGAAAILVTGFPTLIALLKGRDLVAIVQWVQGVQGAPFVSAALLVATMVWRGWASIRKHARLVIAARSAKNSVAIVKGEEAPAEPVEAPAAAADLKAANP